MPVYKAEGVVLARRNLGEADRVLTLLTREFGKLSVKAKAVRRTTSRLAGRLEPFTHARFLLARGRALDVVAQVEVVAGHADLRTDLVRVGHAWLVAEMTDRLLPEAERHPEVFARLVEALDLLAGADPAVAACWYALRLFDALGYRPSTDRCASCGRTLPEGAAWSPRWGGFACVRCAGDDPRAARLGGEAAAAVRFLLRAGPSEAPHLRLSARAAARLEAAVVSYAEARVEAPLRAARVLRTLEP